LKKATSIQSATTNSSSRSSRRARGQLSPDDTIDRLPGAGKVTAARLMEHGLRRVADLLTFFPRSYQDYRREYALSELDGLPVGTPVVVRGTVVRVHKFFRRMLDVILEQGGASLRARWFRPNAGMSKTYAKGNEVVLAGELRRSSEGLCELIHPSNVTALAGEGGLGIRPRYPVVDGVPGRTLEKIVANAVESLADLVPDVLSDELRARLALPDAATALRCVHSPTVTTSDAAFAELTAGVSPAQRRFAFEDLFVLQVGLAEERRLASGRSAFMCVDSDATAVAKAALPFRCTSAQERAIESISKGMQAATPMQCLLQGDVGSGKTAVVFAACVQVARSGGQSLLMAPTAVLAEQHGRSLSAWGQRVGLRTAVLQAGLAATERRRVLDLASSGEVDLIVGTHALLEDGLRLRHLALAIVDEQHRFGVRQRARLRRAGKGEYDWKIAAQTGMVPHLLVLSATPIPRTLALTMYGDLDLVTLDALPPGRQPVETRLCVGDEQDRAYRFVADAVASSGQAFVVCPAIVESGDGPRGTSVVTLAKRLRSELAPARIAVLHGQLANDEQSRVVEAFRNRSLDVLVSTTVLEVGIDVPSATVMVIEDSERFGLSQLHQLRGRVGRGDQRGTCFLLTKSNDSAVLQRLRLVAEVHDGFRIAEEDLRRRGAGDLQGTRQTGAPELRFADFSAYAGLVELAHDEAARVIERDPFLSQPEHAELKRRVAVRWELARPMAEEAG
jgi:ATP-dependent DNA helicase RecG